MELSFPSLRWPLGLSREWLLTNGLGGFASSTLYNINTRRYHALLVAALDPPVRRMVLLSSLEEKVRIGDRDFWLSAHLYPGTVHPDGYRHLIGFKADPFPGFLYSIGGILLEKEIIMPHGQNAVVFAYRVRGGEDIRLEVRPLVTARDYHHLARESGSWTFVQDSGPRKVSIEAYPGAPALRLSASGDYRPEGLWYRDFVYPQERERGLDYLEDLYSPGAFDLRLSPGEEAVLAASTDGGLGLPDPGELRDRENSRLRSLVQAAGLPPEAEKLVLAADAFIVKRASTGKASVIAGYPWFSDWGRDAMIALPGLTLVTGRYDLAGEVLATFRDHASRGLIPNRFTDEGGADYNTADASLWYIQAAFSYLAYTGRKEAFVKEFWPFILEIIDSYCSGTDYGIGPAGGGLIRAAFPGQQLTWMDAKVGEDVITPRAGLPVEINALWYSGLWLTSRLARSLGEDRRARKLESLAEEARESFNRLFWYETGGYLYDYIDENGEPDPAVRPNQVFAVSLPGALLSPERSRRVLRVVRENLVTPLGLRTLAPGDPRYKERYGGDQRQRDSAYHQGTVWPWLIGPYGTALARAGMAAELESIIRPFMDHLSEAGLGQISEIFDGDYPHEARGTVAQAWSVAEILRLYAEEILGRRPAGLQDL